MANIIIVMPAYNAAGTLKRTLQEIPKSFAARIILVDDASKDKTVPLAKKLGLSVFVHIINKGYGGNQKTCYREALRLNPDVVVMLHPDNQYDASRLPNLVQPILDGKYDMMIGSRIRTRREALAGGMPPVKYFLNRIFTITENIILGQNLSEHFSGLRAYSHRTLQTIPFSSFSDDFVFDQQFLVSAVAHGLTIGEVPVPVRYTKDASSIGFVRGSKFLIETLLVLIRFALFRRNFIN